MTPSIYQQKVFDFVQNGSGNAIINAVAGSGKTTTIYQALQLIDSDKSCLLLAFNKSIVEELKTKLKGIDNVNISTLHSLGCRAIMKKFNVQIKEDKYRRFVYSYFDGKNIPSGVDPENELDFKRNIIKLIDLGRVNLVESEEGLNELAHKFEMILFHNEVHFALRFIKWGLQKEDQIDFTDMIYWPVKKDLWVNKYHWVFIDECQDLNAAQRELFLKCLRTDGRFLAVGDPKQAIYGFAGADIESFNILRNLPGTSEFPLSICYRCDAEIVKLAQRLVPQIQSKENADPGVISHCSYNDVNPGDLVLCRFILPLTEVCMMYISQGKKAKILGRDNAKALINLIKKTGKSELDDMFNELDRIYDKSLVRYALKNKIDLSEARESRTMSSLEEQIKALDVISQGQGNAQTLIFRIQEIFGDDTKEGITLSTIHKSKGLEADRVFILLPDKMHASRAMDSEWMREQEYNLEYVAYTRAKHFLGFINDYSK